MPTPANVLAIGWFGAGNLGDEAMLEGLLRLLERALGPVEVTVSTSDPAGTAARYGTPVLRQRSPAGSGIRDVALVRASLRAGLVTLGGGDLIREQADGTAPALNWLARTRTPLRLGRPAALVGVSVGELVTPAVIAEVGRELRRFALLAARDAGSVARLHELTGREVHLMGDLALEALDPLPSRVTAGPPRIGIATRDIRGRGPSVPSSATADLHAELAAALDRVAAETGAEIELVPCRARASASTRDDDRAAGETLAAAAATGASWVRRGPPRTAAAFAEIAADLDLVVAVRLHGAVLGAAAGRRVLGFAYDPKVSGFLEALGLPDQALPLDAPRDRIAEAILRSLGDSGLEARVRAGVKDARAHTRALEPLLAEAAGRGQG